MQMTDSGDLIYVYDVPIMAVNYEYIFELKPTKFANKLNGKFVRKTRVKNNPRF